MRWSSGTVLLMVALLSGRVATLNLMTAFHNLELEEFKFEITRNTSLPCGVDLIAYIAALAGFNFTEDNQWAFKSKYPVPIPTTIPDNYN